MTWTEHEGRWLVDSPADLSAWTVYYIEHWKPGVLRYHIKQTGLQDARMRMVYMPSRWRRIKRRIRKALGIEQEDASDGR